MNTFFLSHEFHIMLLNTTNHNFLIRLRTANKW